MSTRETQAIRTLDSILASAGPDDGQFNREDLEFVRKVLAEQAAKLDKIAALHVPVMEEGNPVGCSLCDWEHPEGSAWPCGTLIALEARA